MHAPLYASHRNTRMDQWLKMLSEGAPFEPAIVWYYSPRITSRAVASSLHLVWANVGLGRPPSAARTRRISSARAAILQNGEHLGLVMPSKGRTRPHRGAVSGTSEQRDDGRAVPPQGNSDPDPLASCGMDRNVKPLSRTAAGREQPEEGKHHPHYEVAKGHPSGRQRPEQAG
jgi:hypothetical protein